MVGERLQLGLGPLPETPQPLHQAPAGSAFPGQDAAANSARIVGSWSFSTASLEAESIAAWIAADIEQSGRPPAEYALIARQRVADLEPELARALAAQGLKLRNDDAQVGELRLQDLLKDDLSRLLIGLVRFGAVRGGQPQTWREVTGTLTRLAPNDGNREVGSSIDDSLSDFLAQLRSWFGATPLDHDATTGPLIDLTEELIEVLVDKLTAFVKYDDIAQKRILADRAR